MKYSKSILAVAALSLVAVACAHDNDRAEQAAAPTVTSGTTTDVTGTAGDDYDATDTGSVSDSDIMSGSDDLSSGTTSSDEFSTDDGTLSGTTTDIDATDTDTTDADTTMDSSTASGTTGAPAADHKSDMKKAKKDKRYKKRRGESTTPSSSGTTIEPMDDSWGTGTNDDPRVNSSPDATSDSSSGM